MQEAATQESLLRDLLGDGTDPVAVFLLAPGQEDGVFAAFEPYRAGSTETRRDRARSRVGWRNRRASLSRACCAGR